MWLTSRRWGLLYFCLAGMEMAWFTPYFLLFYWPLEGYSAWVAFLGLFGALLGFILMLEFLSLAGLDWPFYELAVAGLVILSSLLFVRLWFYTAMPAGDLRWLGNTLGALFDFQQGIRPELVLILTSVFLWQRAANATSRDTGFFTVGLSFRLGLLLLIVGAAVAQALRGQDARPILWLFLGLGLTAVALARTHDKAADMQSRGALLSPRRLGQLLLAVGVTVGLAAGLSFLYTPDTIKQFLLTWLRPLWTLLSPALRLLLRLLEPVIIWLVDMLIGLLTGLDWSFASQFLESLGQRMAEGQTAQPEQVMPVVWPPWVWSTLRTLLVLLAIALALGLVLIFLERMHIRPDGREEREEEGGEELSLGGAALARGVRWLRDMAGLVRRFGLSQQLLAAISVQNLYANLCRLARQRGYPRRPAQPPDDYLPALAQAFPGQQEALARITVAYMRVHYGDQPVSPAELSQLRQDYQQVQGNK